MYIVCYAKELKFEEIVQNYQLTLQAPLTTTADDILNLFFLLYFKENKS